MKSQEQMILEHLRQKPISPIEALNQYGCFRLAAVIFNLRGQGHNIHSGVGRGTNGKKWAVYSLLDVPAKPFVNETVEKMKQWEQERKEETNHV